MKRINWTRLFPLLLMSVLLMGVMQSCKEDIDMSDRYTFKEFTIAGYLANQDSTYSEYIKLLSDVKISKRSESTVYQLLSARGKYTVFAPTNKAIQNYLDTLCAAGIINEPSWDGFKSEHDLDSIREVIVYNSILDGTKDDLEPIQSGGFPEDSREFPIANMNERKLNVCYGNNPDSIYVNAAKDKAGNIIRGSLIDLKNHDIFTINGYIHQVHTVIAPSNETLSDLFMSYLNTMSGDFIVAAKMMLATGLSDTLTKVKDEVYENLVQSADPRVQKLPNFNGGGSGQATNGDLPEHRYYGFTVFAEPDDFWRSELGKEPAEITPEDVQEWVVKQGFYPDGLDNTDYTDENNILNLFFTYHLLPMRLTPDKIVIHHNERGYNYKNTSQNYTVPVYEIYTTMGKRRLIKLYQAGPHYSLDGTSKLYINRFPVLNNGRDEDYSEKSITPETEGVVIDTENAIGLINAYIYPIYTPIAYDDNTRSNLQKQRLRYDLTSLCPEFMNNDMKDNRSLLLYTGLPEDKNYKYLENIDLLNGTNFYFLNGMGMGWYNWQGDEFNIRGKYEVIFRLPPVPKAGTYEIRFAIQSNSDKRSMCQVYFGKDKDKLAAMGIPLDLRQGGISRHLASGTVPSSLVGWEEDTEDDDYNAEVDKKMRNNGFMKGPAIYACPVGGSMYARNRETNLRRIIVREYMQPETQYYLKFKSVLDDDLKEFYMDYFEYCAKEVYDNPATPEDIW
ncbi:MAG: hypothetical protein IJV08_06415 [Bacteroidaceae bacterium]|nr:hypothetical protein [Bacteroidaceae bacterium]